MKVAVNGALTIREIEMGVLADESRTGAVEKRGVMEGFGELEEWSAGLEDDGARIVLGFWVRVDSKLVWTVRALWVGCGRPIVGQKRWL